MIHRYIGYFNTIILKYNNSFKEREDNKMRKEAKTKNRNVSSNNIQQGYHRVVNYDNNYAFQGFGSNKYFTSDRTITLDSNWLRNDGKALKGYGLEVEMECHSINNSEILARVWKELVLDKYFPKDLWKQQRDGSLGGNSSTECITQVMTKEFVRNHYADFKALWDSMVLFGCTTYSTNCGMHINISNACFGRDAKVQEDAIKKLCYLINNNFKLFKHAFYRQVGARETYFSRFNHYSKDYCKTMDLTSFYSDHHTCINLGHFTEGRIELRIVGGQKNFASFRNTMELVFFLVERMKDLTWKNIDDLSVVFKGCNQYVYDRLTMESCRNYMSNDILSEIDANKVTENYI